MSSRSCGWSSLLSTAISLVLCRSSWNTQSKEHEVQFGRVIIDDGSVAKFRSRNGIWVGESERIFKAVNLIYKL
jgi:hypothetical protein